MFRRGSRVMRLRHGSTVSRDRSRALVAELETQPAGRFGSAFLASFITIVREGVEVILILAMLLALVGKATNTAGLRALSGTDRAAGDLESAMPELGRGGYPSQGTGGKGDLVGSGGGSFGQCRDGDRLELSDRVSTWGSAGDARRVCHARGGRRALLCELLADLAI